jgi:hypothetical protein
VPEDLFRPSLGEPHHYGYLVDDIEATVGLLVDQLGAGPFFLVEDVPLENILSRGESAKFAHNSSFGYSGGGPIELIETNDLSQGLHESFEMVRSGVEGWDGSEPLRPVAT